ncbi:hypothetical protein [Hymenobacter koreensis]
MFLLRACTPLFVLLLVTSAASAQKYRTAIGTRIGGGNYGLTVQQKIGEKTTLEGLGLIVSTREVTATLLAERHFPILGPSLNYYFGAGGHVGRHKEFGAVGGFDVLAGAEYKVAFLPVVLSFDFKPSYEIGGEDWFRFPSAFSVRYVLIKEKKKESMLDGLFGGDKDRERSREPRRNKKSESQPRLLDRIF